MNKNIQILSCFLLFFFFVFPVSADASLYERAKTHFYQEGILTKKNQDQDTHRIVRVEFLKLALENTGFSPHPKMLFVPTPYKDVDPKSWYAPYVQKSYRIGLFENSDLFQPEAPIRLYEALRTLLFIEGYPVPRLIDKKLSFRDVRTLEEKALVAKSLELGIISPHSESFFGLQKYISRKEAIELVYKFYLLSEGEKAINETSSTIKIQIEDTKSSLKNIDYLESIRDQIFSKYYKPENLDEQELMDSAIEGFVRGVEDKYTVYFPPQDSKDFVDSVEGSFEGIGAFLEETDQGIVIQTPIKGSPAEQAGVKAGDIIQKVNGVDVTGMPISEVVPLIKGPAGTNVEIDFQRNGSEVHITITRARVEIPSLEAVVRNDILVITLHQFNGNTSLKFSDALSEFYNPSIRGIVLDLRSNPGGFLSTAEEILSYWVPEGDAVVQLKYKHFTQEKPAQKNQLLFGVPTAILQNKASASASEIVAGTLQDYKFAKVFGENSFGKGTVQEIVQYRNGSSLKLTVAEWLTGKGKSINEVGVASDISIENKDSTPEDDVLEKAILWILSL